MLAEKPLPVRLRAQADFFVQNVQGVDQVIDLLREAADRIEALEAGAPIRAAVEALKETLAERQAAKGVFVELNTLKWWRELVDLNPGDLAPRLDARIRSALTVGDQPK